MFCKRVKVFNRFRPHCLKDYYFAMLGGNPAAWLMSELDARSRDKVLDSPIDKFCSRLIRRFKRSEADLMAELHSIRYTLRLTEKDISLARWAQRKASIAEHLDYKNDIETIPSPSVRGRTILTLTVTVEAIDVTTAVETRRDDRRRDDRRRCYDDYKSNRDKIRDGRDRERDRSRPRDHKDHQYSSLGDYSWDRDYRDKDRDQYHDKYRNRHRDNDHNDRKEMNVRFAYPAYHDSGSTPFEVDTDDEDSNDTQSESSDGLQNV